MNDTVADSRYTIVFSKTNSFGSMVSLESPDHVTFNTNGAYRFFGSSSEALDCLIEEIAIRDAIPIGDETIRSLKSKGLHSKQEVKDRYQN